MAKPKKRMNRLTFWAWTVPIVAAHVVLTVLMVNRVNGPWSSFDTALLFFLATALARRFRDIGWPAWIGPTFAIVTMLGIPMAVIGYAFISMPTSQQLLEWIATIGLVTGPLNLVLIVMAGCVPGQPDIDSQIVSEFS